MKKVLYVVGGIVILAILVLVLRNQQFDTANVKFDQNTGVTRDGSGINLSQAKIITPDSKPCLKSNDALKLSTQQRSDIEMGTILHILDVPAGTNVDIRISTANDKEVTGSAIYEKDYGTYNYKLAKETDPNVHGRPWKVASFKPCSD